MTVARDAGCKVAYLPGLAMRRIADLYPGEAKTDAMDAEVIADAARTLRSLELTDEITAELTVLTGFDQNLAAEATRTSNRIRGLLVVVPGTGTPRRRHPVPGPLAGVHEQRRALEAQINALLEAHPASPVLTSMPGVGVRTAAVLLVTVGDGTGFPSAAHPPCLLHRPRPEHAVLGNLDPRGTCTPRRKPAAQARHVTFYEPRLPQRTAA
ncbi:hypothetical protein GCM10010342_52910 [Streptomyces anulatus]|nr:hypothetical protein GCM10010342_52910 [Streptomyces anulatus]